MAKEWYPFVDEITNYDWHELWAKSNKAIVENKSPHVEPKVELPAKQLLQLLEMVKGKVR